MSATADEGYDDDADWIGVETDDGHVLLQTGGDNATRVAVWDAKNNREAVIELTDDQLADLRDALNSLYD
ncbi:hypothetical protein [Nocardia asteroides]|uniref:hypothetical protein n=1 Tax=Nocardia asteroides TaxID=1824 RepID=UPI0033FD66C0